MAKYHQQLKEALAGRRLGQPLLWLPTTGSTNDILKAKAQAAAPEGYLVVAAEQTQGRGRQGKRWISENGQGVYMSLLLRPGWPASASQLLSLLAGLAVAQALEAIGLKRVQLKWPNDVLVDGKKIAGILVEPRINSQRIDFAVVGIGINVTQGQADWRRWGLVATSCHLERFRASRAQVLIEVLKKLESCYAWANQHQENRILEAWSGYQIKP